ncbi:MAG: hypothetical protein K1X29_03565 [Bdellovibrionales bacterium]|nr:hypothetical protein [Bdellovibrionales bacterium]
MKSTLKKIKNHCAIPLGLIWFLFLTHCQSAESYRDSANFTLPDRDEKNTAPGAAYAGESMHLRKSLPSHRDWQPTEFYFKHCSQTDEAVFYSKTSYECSYP